MKKSDKIFIAGHKGLVGSAIYEKLINEGYKNLLVIDRNKLDLRDFRIVKEFFKNKKIDYMVMCAAKAGGIMANSSQQKDFFLENIDTKFIIKVSFRKKYKKDNFFRNFMHLS